MTTFSTFTGNTTSYLLYLPCSRIMTHSRMKLLWQVSPLTGCNDRFLNYFLSILFFVNKIYTKAGFTNKSWELGCSLCLTRTWSLTEVNYELWVYDRKYIMSTLFLHKLLPFQLLSLNHINFWTGFTNALCWFHLSILPGYLDSWSTSR